MKKAFPNINKRGFTLIELLVVIAIIAILSTIGLTLFNGVQQNARDARRRSDVDAIVAALETKRSSGVSYYSTIADTDFSVGKVPADTTSTKYCIKVYTTIDGAKSETVPADATDATWKFAGVGSNVASATPLCPTGYWVADTSNAFATGNSKAFTDGSGVALTTILSWRVCARLENTNAAAGPGYTAGNYCKNSAQ